MCRVEQLVDLESGQLEHFLIHQVRFRERDHTRGYRQESTDLQMFFGLWLDSFVGGYDEEHDTNTSQTSEGVVHEALVPGDIDEAHLQILRFEMCKPEIDGDPSPFFFFPAVAIDTGKRLDQGGLPVVDVSGCSDNYRPHEKRFLMTRLRESLGRCD